jgi:hypothetical protein
MTKYGIFLENDTVVLESHLICDMCFWADIDGYPSTFHVGIPT